MLCYCSDLPTIGLALDSLDLRSPSKHLHRLCFLPDLPPHSRLALYLVTALRLPKFVKH